MDLFDSNENLKKHSPLADRMRPETLSEFFGQEHLIGKGLNGKAVGETKILRQLIETDQVPSMILWGPPGTGKTTLARVIANVTHSVFVSLSAVSAGVSQLKEVVLHATERKKFHGEKTILFIDEVHRWNKTQQDALLPYVENGTVVLVGATTENPSFEVNGALLSRARVFVLEQLSIDDISKIIKRALQDKIRGLGWMKIRMKESVIKYLANFAGGDARAALNALEIASQTLPGTEKEITKELIHEALQKSHYLYDKSGDQHYNIISALHKSLRGSDANAALYWLMRMFVAGEDPLYIARRLVRFASEDVGLANSQALTQAVAGYQACQFLGRPECDVHLAQVVVYLARCKKSNELYSAILAIKKDMENTMDEPVPINLRNAPTKLMKNLGYGKDYKYPPAYADRAGNRNFSELILQEYLPRNLKNKKWLRD